MTEIDDPEAYIEAAPDAMQPLLRRLRSVRSSSGPGLSTLYYQAMLLT